jgi:hypothetical protein
MKLFSQFHGMNCCSAVPNSLEFGIAKLHSSTLSPLKLNKQEYILSAVIPCLYALFNITISTKSRLNFYYNIYADFFTITGLLPPFWADNLSLT